MSEYKGLRVRPGNVFETLAPGFNRLWSLCGPAIMDWLANTKKREMSPREAVRMRERFIFVPHRDVALHYLD